MIERITRDLERERATSRNLRRELDALRSRVGRAPPRGVVGDGERHAGDGRGAGAGDRRRPQRPHAARHAAPRRRRPRRRRASACRGSGPRRSRLWAVRILAALVIAVLGIALVVLVSVVT